MMAGDANSGEQSALISDKSRYGISYDGKTRFADENFRTWRDVLFALLFFVHLGGMIAYTVDAAKGSGFDSEDDDDDDDEDWYLRSVKIIGTCLAISIGFAILFLLVVKNFIAQIIRISLYGSILLSAICSVVCFMYNAIAPGICLAILAFSALIYYISVRNQINFAATTVSASVEAIEAFPVSIFYAFCTTILMIGWICLFVFMAIVILKGTNEYVAMCVFLTFSFYWAAGVIRNILHVTVCGIVGQWYFLGKNAPSNAARSSLGHALTTSFGSICAGSLLVALVKAIRFLINYIREKLGEDEERNCLAKMCCCLVSCCMGCVEWVLELVNDLAYVQCAIYGTSFFTASSDTFKLLKSRGYAMLASNTIVDGVLTLGCCLGAIPSTIIGALWAYSEYDGEDHDAGKITFVTAACFCTGYVVVAQVLQLVNSGADTILMCVIEDPNALQVTHSGLYHRLASAWGEAYGRCEWYSGKSQPADP
eukprot:TRINITY_DN19014_c0_g1::TRINITY_DN19014_c0_g1_i1::g.21582::m.21582 TRINITY_DN19014_c0_g1::TRINITY_DN19014_c0_g1_i1::g.21582  ORF type:complete len:482 (-),score=111.17,sp/Q869R1/CTLHB_DICDI/27.49/1e-45,Choline_transpo/PF04515.7/2.2e+03,Choline_transpo/PF04515.7/1.8e-68 TRINITY_DN19014_c0_g1_i1:453-1898(-)